MLIFNNKMTVCRYPFWFWNLTLSWQRSLSYRNQYFAHQRIELKLSSKLLLQLPKSVSLSLVLLWYLKRRQKVTETFLLQTPSHFEIFILTSSEKFTRTKFVLAKGIDLSSLTTYRTIYVILRNLDF